MARWSARVGVLTFVIAVTSVISAYIFFKQYSSMSGQQSVMQGQLDEMQTENRPWIKADITIQPISPFWVNGSLLFLLDFSLKNYGQSPATNIQVEPEMIITPDMTPSGRQTLVNMQQLACQSSRAFADANPIGGITIFPSDTGSLSRDAFVMPSPKNAEIYSVVGCVDYTYAGGRHGQTGFRMLLNAVVPKIGDHTRFAVPIVTVRAFSPDPFGGNYTQ